MDIEELRIIGKAKEKVSVISFVIEEVHSLDVENLLVKLGIALRKDTTAGNRWGNILVYPLPWVFDCCFTLLKKKLLYRSMEYRKQLKC